ncbi:MAG TPA: FtsX-like permease family protein [Thermotogota bacterium]|nr:FtsX-like permease family protein [Thermotogota bacterium]HPR94682.1 FtsX-like permease family protein [Thermotogota bacterium]
MFLLKDKKIRSIALKNLFRRKAQTLLIILGSMVGTAMITGSLGINDSMKFMLFSQTNRNIGETDLIVYKGNLPSQTHDPFEKGIVLQDFSSDDNSNLIQRLKSELHTDFVSEIYVMDINIFHGTNTISSIIDHSTVKIIAFDFNHPGIFPIDKGITADVIIDNTVFNLNSGDKSVISISKSTGKTLEIFNKKIPLSNYIFSNEELLRLNVFDSHTEQKKCVYMDLDYFYRLFPEKENRLNSILISNTGDWMNGRVLSARNINLFNQMNLQKREFHILDIKNEEIDDAGQANIGYVFLFLSFFSILAGLFLIINTFNMLAKERAKELGMLRAIGFLRRDINKLFFLEGIFYTIFSSGLGVLCGMFVSKYILGNITQYAFSLSNKFLDAIGSAVINITDIPEFKFYISPDSILISYIAGIVISMITIYFFSRKISNFNIVNAIKGIDEEKEKKTRLKNIFMYLLSFTGVVLTLYGNLANSTNLSYLGISLFLLTVALLLFYFTKKRKMNMIISVILYNFPIILLLYLSFRMNIDLELFPLQYLLLIIEKSLSILLALSLLCLNNLVLLRILLTKTHISKLFKPYVLKIGIAYPENERRKTALMIAMYSLVIYIIVLVSVIPYTQQKGIERSKDTIFWSYNAFVPDIFNSTSDELKNEIKNQSFIENVNELYTAILIENTDLPQQIFIADEQLHIDADIGTWYGKKSITSVDDALESMYQNKNQYIVLTNETALEKSDEREIELNKELNAEQLGIFVFNNISFFQGIVSNNKELFKDSNIIKYLFVKIKGENQSEISKNKELFKAYAEKQNIFVITDDDVIEISNVAIMGMIQILNGFLYFGMIIGIIGISITMYRAFLERKKVIGMLKAIGFTSKEIFSTFLFETTIIVVIGLFIGILSGITTSSLFNALLSDVGAPGGNILAIPWLVLGRTVIIFYICSLFSTFIPSFQASRLNPAEALKYYE